MQIIAADGVPIQFEIVGEGEPVLFLHGFTGSGASWRSVAALLGGGLRAVLPDIRGHGGSRLKPGDACTLAACVSDLVILLDHLDIDRVAVAGYSMGGRLALHFALAHPERLCALVLEGVSPGIEDPEERAKRRESDEALAHLLEEQGVEAFVDYWMALPLFATQRRLGPERLAAARAARLSQDEAGLAASLRGMGAGAQEPLWGRLGAISVPTLLIAGEEDARYAEMAQRMAKLMPHAEVRLIPAAGHAAHLEDPQAFTNALRELLASFQL